MHGNTDWDDANHLGNTESLTESTESQWTSSGISSQDSTHCNSHCNSMTKSKCLLLRLGETPENITGRIIFMTMCNDMSGVSRDNE